MASEWKLEGTKTPISPWTVSKYNSNNPSTRHRVHSTGRIHHSILTTYKLRYITIVYRPINAKDTIVWVKQQQYGKTVPVPVPISAMSRIVEVYRTG